MTAPRTGCDAICGAALLCTPRTLDTTFLLCQSELAGRFAPMAHASNTSDIPLAIWPCAQTTSQWQRHGRYVRESNRHPGKMLPELARRAIDCYSEPGDLVVDPMCGIGTTLAEAVRLDRDAIGVELESHWAELAKRNVARARSDGAPGHARVLRGDARKLPKLLARKNARALRDPSGTSVAHLPLAGVDLVLTSPPYGCEVGEIDKSAWHTGREICRTDTRNYSRDRTNIGHARGTAYAEAMLDIYRACATVVKPGGFVVIVTKDMRRHGKLRNLAGETVDLCQRAGLDYWQHIVALLATIRDAELVPRPSFWQITQTRSALVRGDRSHLVCHEDVLVFRRPTNAPPKGARR
jgi:modification methylase